MIILVADDEEMIRFSIVNMLEEFELKNLIIKEASDGEELIKLANEIKPQILLVDIKMPKINGLDAIKECKSFLSESIFIIISSYEDFNFAKEAIKLSVKEYLLKPVKPEELKESIEKAAILLNENIFDQNFEIIDQVKKFVDKNYMNNIGIAQIAYDHKITPNYLSYLFHKKTGINFMKYLTDIRMLKAKEMLNIPGIKIHKIAENVGFNNSKHFTKIFLKYYNCIPSEFIKSKLNTPE
jgi:two-component system, response regulator YesN